MSNTTTTPKARNRTGTLGSRIRKPQATHPSEAYPRIVRKNRTTHFLVPADEYERLIAELDVRRLEAKANDPNAEWMDARDFAKVLAVDQIIQAREKAGLTQKQLAERLKMPQSQISRIERNPDRTTVRTLKKIAAALNVDVRSLL